MKAPLALLLCLLPALALAQAPTTSISADAKRVRLSESLKATLTVEGTAPLRVELPKPLLEPVSDRDWKIQPLGKPAVTPAGPGRERWTQTFRLDPYVAGESLDVIFAPLKANGRELSPGGFSVAVVSTVPEAKANAARPVTGIEELPPPPEAPAARVHPVWWVAGGLVAGFALALVWRHRQKTPPPAPEQWAAAAFDRLERGEWAGAELVERAAAILREFIDRKFGIPAPKLTTPELLAAAEQAGRSVEEADSLRGVLDRCDRAKFAGDVPDDDGCRSLLTAARDWVNDVSTAGAGPG